MKLFSLLIVLFLAAIVFGAEAESSFDIQRNGIITWKQIRLYLINIGPDWSGSSQSKMMVTKKYDRTADKFDINGVMPAAGVNQKLTVTESINKISANKLQCTYKVKADEPIKYRDMSMSIDFPANDDVKVEVDGKEQALPSAFSKIGLAKINKASKILIKFKGKNLVINGDFRVSLQDNRKFKQQTFSLRLSSPNKPPKLESFNLDITITIE